MSKAKSNPQPPKGGNPNTGTRGTIADGKFNINVSGTTKGNVPTMQNPPATPTKTTK